MDFFSQAKAEIRDTDLKEAVKTHQYMADAYDAEVWMNEKEPLVTNPNYGDDEDTAQVNFIYCCSFLCSGLLPLLSHNMNKKGRMFCRNMMSQMFRPKPRYPLKSICQSNGRLLNPTKLSVEPITP